MGESNRAFNQDDELDDEDLQRNARTDQPGDEDEPYVPVTGDDYVVAGEPLDMVNLSDLVDLSDAEEMEELADQVRSDEVQDLIDTDAVEMGKYTKDQDVLDDLANRQVIPTGSDKLLEELRDHTGESPEITADDLDADWRTERESGEEAVGGSVATPEQNIVDELGEAVGIEYNDFEELETEDRIADRDINRWELNPASADDDETMVDYDRNKSAKGRSDDASIDEVDEDFSALMNNDEEDLDEDISAMLGEDDDDEDEEY